MIAFGWAVYTGAYKVGRRWEGEGKNSSEKVGKKQFEVVVVPVREQAADGGSSRRGEESVSAVVVIVVVVVVMRSCIAPMSVPSVG